MVVEGPLAPPTLSLYPVPALLARLLGTTSWGPGDLWWGQLGAGVPFLLVFCFSFPRRVLAAGAGLRGEARASR